MFQATSTGLKLGCIAVNQDGIMITRTAHHRLIIMILACFLGAAHQCQTTCSAGEKLHIRLTAKTATQPAAFEAQGVPTVELTRLKSLENTDPAFAQIFAVYVGGDAPTPAVLPVGGSYRVEGARLVFTPRYPPVPGLKYRAVLRLPAGTDQTDTQIDQVLALTKGPEADVKVARVEQIYPSGDLLPENHLRFYIHFSAPIERGLAYQNLELLDESGTPVEAAFLELGEELWDPSGQRFTLLLDPGRIKQGLKPREELGPILHSGKKYTLVVKCGWHDLQGRPLAKEFRKSFAVGPVIDEPIKTQRWKFNTPRTGTAEPLVVRFPRPLDHALLERTLTVVDRAGQRVAGQVRIGDAERRWEFTPDSPWTADGQQLVVDTVLEDTAGNSIARAFEVDEQYPITKSVMTETLKLPITFIPNAPVEPNAAAP